MKEVALALTLAGLLAGLMGGCDQKARSRGIAGRASTASAAKLKVEGESVEARAASDFKKESRTLAARSAGEDPKGSLTVSLDSSELVLIPGGEFSMGSPEKEGYDNEHPRHRVHVDSFYLGKYEVTNARWKRFVDANPAWRKDGALGKGLGGSLYLHHWAGDSPSAGKENHPVIYVSWYAAQAYCKWAGLRLPTEAEWEYAAQGGKGYEYGTATGKLSEGLANYGMNVRDTTKVGSYPPNPFGIHDLCGNVDEWCSSAYKSYPYNAKDGRENYNSNDIRVLRGGCWGLFAHHTAARLRCANPPMTCNKFIGFRVARDANTPELEH